MILRLAYAVLLCLGLAGIGPAMAGNSDVELEIGGSTALGTLNVPNGKSLSDGVLVLTHGTLAHKDMELIKALQAGLAERGIATLAHTLTLSLDRRKGMYDCKQPHAHAHSDGVNEIGAWVDWLKKQGAGKISVLGHSRGGNQVAWYASNNGDIEKVVLLAPALGLSGKFAAEVLKRRSGADITPYVDTASALASQGKSESMLDVPAFIYCPEGKASARALLSYYTDDERRNAIANIKNIAAPILVIAGSKDTAVPDVPKKIKPIADGTKVRFALVEGADHMFLDFYAEDVADIVASFLRD